MKIKTNNKAPACPDRNAAIDYQPLIDLFGVLLEWDTQDVQEKEEQEERKKVSKKF